MEHSLNNTKHHRNMHERFGYDFSDEIFVMFGDGHRKLISPLSRIYASVNQVSIASDNGLSSIRQYYLSHYVNQCFLLLIVHLGTNCNEIPINIWKYSFTKMHLKISSDKWQPFFSGEDELRRQKDALLRHHNDENSWLGVEDLENKWRILLMWGLTRFLENYNIFIKKA